MGRIVTVVYYPHGLDKEPAWAIVGLAKIGRRYIYLQWESDWGREWKEIERDKALLFYGRRDDVVRAVEDFRRELDRWHQMRGEERKKIEVEEWQRYRAAVEKRLEEWTKQNPRPVFRLPGHIQTAGLQNKPVQAGGNALKTHLTQKWVKGKARCIIIFLTHF